MNSYHGDMLRGKLTGDRVGPCVAVMRVGYCGLGRERRVELKTVTGDAVLSTGYPTGIEGILARAGSNVSQKIVSGTQDDVAWVALLRGGADEVLRSELRHDAIDVVAPNAAYST